MAEVVERNLEASLDEILYIKKAKLFKKHEINELIRKRRQHEYSLQKRNKRVLDYDSYITTELTVLRLLRFRRQETEDRRYLDKIERSIITRLVRLHRQLCYRFQSRIDLWMRFVKFYCILGRHMSAVRLWNRVLQVHGRTDPRLWAAAASYHLHQNAKSKIKSSLRNLSRETSQLSDKRNELRSELNALSQYLRKKDQARVNRVLRELREICGQLRRANHSLLRERRIATDRVFLSAIREARRLLTEGIALNPECDSLHLELLKLEANAADFFKTRILPRYKAQTDEGDKVVSNEAVHPESGESKEAMDVTEAKQTEDASQLEEREKFLLRRAIEDNETLLSEVTEDVPFLASGGALNLVLRSLLDRWSSNRTMLESVQQVITSVPQFVDEESKQLLQDKLSKCPKEDTKAASSSAQHPPRSVLDDARDKLRDQMSQLCQAMMNDSPVEAIHLWNSWYTVPTTGADLFRAVDPTLDDAVGLFRMRMSIATVQANWSSTELTDLCAKGKWSKQEVVRQTRLWLDGLATSRWGEKCPEFWMQYLTFERDCGDCTRLPAVQWRASKLLNENAYHEMTRMLNAAES